MTQPGVVGLVKTCVSHLLLLFDASNRTELAGMLALQSPAVERPPRGRGSTDRATGEREGAGGKPPPGKRR